MLATVETSSASFRSRCTITAIRRLPPSAGAPSNNPATQSRPKRRFAMSEEHRQLEAKPGQVLLRAIDPGGAIGDQVVDGENDVGRRPPREPDVEEIHRSKRASRVEVLVTADG